MNTYKQTRQTQPSLVWSANFNVFNWAMISSLLDRRRDSKSEIPDCFEKKKKVEENAALRASNQRR